MPVGDSGAYHLGPALAEAGGGAGAVVATSPQILCTVIGPEGVTRRSDGQEVRREVCPDDRHERWGELADVFQPDGVLDNLANAGGIGAPLLDGEHVSDCDPAYDAYLRDALPVDADRPGTEVVELNELVADQIAGTDVDMFEDPVHLSEEGARIVSDWLLPEVERLLSAASEPPTVPGS